MANGQLTATGGQVQIPDQFRAGSGQILTGQAAPAGAGTFTAGGTLPTAQQLAQTTTGQVPPTGQIGLEQAIQAGTRGGLQTLGQGIGAAQGEIDIGNIGLENQAALAGLRGPEAQQQAFDAFQSSPGQQFLTEQAERSLLRNQAATGGLGGGNVLQELQRQAIGLAQQDFGNQFARGQQVLGSQQASAQQLAQLSATGGILGADILTGAGSEIGQARLGTGQQIAAATGSAAANLSNLQQQLGQGIAGITGQGATNIANLLSGTGTASAQLTTQLATLLANIGTGGASQAAQLNSLAGQFDAAGILGQGQAASGAVSDLASIAALAQLSGTQ